MNNYNGWSCIRTIQLTQDQFAVVDEIDYEYLNQYNWFASHDKDINGYYALRTQNMGYLNGKQKRKNIVMHRRIMEKIVGRELKRTEVIDHINHNPLDNTRDNLRIVSNRQNCQNRKRKGSSKYPGVYWKKNAKKWRAHIQINGKPKHLGYFNNEREAARAYEKACRELVGEEIVCKTIRQ